MKSISKVGHSALHYAEENPDEVSLHKTEAVIRALVLAMDGLVERQPVAPLARLRRFHVGACATETKR
jgi:hypothetical protein